MCCTPHTNARCTKCRSCKAERAIGGTPGTLGGGGAASAVRAMGGVSAGPGTAGGDQAPTLPAARGGPDAPPASEPTPQTDPSSEAWQCIACQAPHSKAMPACRICAAPRPTPVGESPAPDVDATGGGSGTVQESTGKAQDAGGKLVGQAAADRRALLEDLRAVTLRAGMPTAAIDAELSELAPPPPPASAPGPSALAVLQAAKEALALATKRHEAAITKVAGFEQRLKNLQVDLACGRTAVANAERELKAAREAELVAARAVAAESERATAPSPTDTQGTPAPPTPKVDRVRENVASLQHAIEAAGGRIASIKATMSAEWDKYAASEVVPKLSMTDWLVEKYSESLLTELLVPARQVCADTLQLMQPPATNCSSPERTPRRPWADSDGLAGGSESEEELDGSAERPLGPPKRSCPDDELNDSGTRVEPGARGVKAATSATAEASSPASAHSGVRGAASSAAAAPAPPQGAALADPSHPACHAAARFHTQV